MSQVVVVGRANPAHRLWEPDIRSRISWHRLTAMDTDQAAKAISGVLREIHARYAGRDWRTCRKTHGLIRNLNYLKAHRGGPKGFIEDVANLYGSSRDKVAFVAKRLSFIKNKGARDLLTTGFGLVSNHIAFDSRVLGAIRHIGVLVPNNVTSRGDLYDQLEKDLIEQVCRPIGITGAQLDQLLFRHYKEIKQRKW